MDMILDFVLWTVLYLGGSLIFAIAMGKFIHFGQQEEPQEPMPQSSMPQKD